MQNLSFAMNSTRYPLSANFTTTPAFDVRQLGLLNTVTAVLMWVQAVVAFPGEAFVAYVILSKKEQRKSVNFITLNHLVAESFVVIQWCTLTFYYIMIEPNELLCRFTSVLLHTVEGVAFLTNGLLSYNRYYAMFHEEEYRARFNNRNTLLFIAGTWALAAFFCVGTMADTGRAYGYLNFCYPDMDLGKWQSIWVLMGTTVGTFSISYSVSIYCNLKIYHKLHRHVKDIHCSKMKAAKMLRFREIQNMIIVFCTLPPALSGPAVIGTFIPAYGNYPWLGRLSGLMVFTVPCVTPYVTIFCLKAFRDEAHHLWRKFKRCLPKIRINISVGDGPKAQAGGDAPDGSRKDFARSSVVSAEAKTGFGPGVASTMVESFAPEPARENDVTEPPKKAPMRNNFLST